MKINNLPPINSLNSIKSSQINEKMPKVADNNLNNVNNINFGTVFQEALNKVNDSQKDAAVAAKDFIIGNSDSVHTLMIATEKAQLAMDMTLAVRNKVLDAYKELMRLQF